MRQKDFDGKTTVSKVISLNKSATFSVQLFPNPVTNQLKIRLKNIESGYSEDNQVHIYDLRGQLIFAKAGIGLDSEIDVSDFPNGMYVVEIQAHQHIHRQKIVKNL